MTVNNTRLVLSALTVISSTTIIYEVQNFSPTPIPVYNYYGFTDLIDYESFSVGDMVFESNNLSNTCTVTFPATVALLTLLDGAVANTYDIILDNFRTPPNASPLIYNPFGTFAGSVFSMDMDLITLTLTIARSATATEADFPWRRYSSNIISPVLAG